MALDQVRCTPQLSGPKRVQRVAVDIASVASGRHHHGGRHQRDLAALVQNCAVGGVSWRGHAGSCCVVQAWCSMWKVLYGLRAGMQFLYLVHEHAMQPACSLAQAKSMRIGPRENF